MTDGGKFAGLEFSCGKRTPHIIQILSISNMHIASTIDGYIYLDYVDVFPLRCTSIYG